MPSMTSGNFRSRPEIFPRIMAGAAAFVGALALIGWTFDISILKSIHHEFVPMNPITSFAFILSGLSLWTHGKTLARVTGALICIVGLLRVMGVLGWDFAIDRVLFSQSLGTNRMAPNTAMAFVLLGAALSTQNIKPWKNQRVADLLALGSLLFGMVAITGYIYGVRSLYGVTGFIPMALNTGFTFIFISLGVLFSQPTQGIAEILFRKDFGGRMARSLIPAVILAPIALGWLELHGVRSGWFIHEVGSALRSVITILIMTLLVVWSAKSLSQNEQLLRTMNEELERKIAERINQLKESENQVQQLQKMDAIGRLAGGVAHDFNNLLAAIKMYCDLLCDEPSNSQVVLENTQEIKKVAERGAALTRQLLIFSRKQIVHCQPIDLNRLIHDLKKMLDRLIVEDIKIQTKFGSPLDLIKADAGQIEQVIMNLVVNARDAMPQGGTITIETSNVVLDEQFTNTHLTVNRGPHVVLCVSDTGTGMDAATQTRIFEPFFTTKPIGKGTGLGLTTVYGIVKQTQGTIWVYSELGKGTVFKVYLPVDESSTAMSEPKPLREISTEPETGTILLVEDEERLRKLFSEMLRKRGYQVLVAENGIMALELCKNHPGEIDLLLTDIVMPQMGGFKLAQQIALLRPKLKVLYMSGYANEALSDQQNPLTEGISFIQKPFDAKALLAKIGEVRKL